MPSPPRNAAPTFTSDDGDTPTEGRAGESGAVLARRYELIRPIRRGQFGEVWRARDRSRNEDVACKRLFRREPRDLQVLYCELAALRWALVPGVVHLRDDFIEHGTPWIVMDLVQGKPFPGPGSRHSWAQIRDASLRLLETLARLHFVGLVHRDLKPDNVMVDGDGRLTVLDLGIAGGERLRWAHSSHGPRFTPIYAAPEQRRPPYEVNPQADIYAVGTMIWEALCGARPLDGASPRQLFGGDADPPLPAFSVTVDGVPDTIEPLLRRMLAHDLAVRPASAIEVIRELGGVPTVLCAGLLEDLPERADRQSLQALFYGPDRFLHLTEDAAEQLWQRTGGWRVHVVEELDAWARSGLAVVDGAQIRIGRDALSRLQSGLRLRVQASQPPTTLPDTARTVLECARAGWPYAGRAWVAERAGLARSQAEHELDLLTGLGLVWEGAGGTLGAEVALDAEPRIRAQRSVDQPGPYPPVSVERLVALLQPEADPAVIMPLVEALATAAFREGTLSRLLPVIEMALARIGPGLKVSDVDLLLTYAALGALEHRYGEMLTVARRVSDMAGEMGSALAEPVRTLLRAVWSKNERAVDDAWATLADMPPLPDDRLELARLCERVEVAILSQQHHPQRLPSLLDESEPWARAHQAREAKWIGWMGLRRYQELRLSEAAELHQRAAALKTETSAVLSSLVNAAFALLDADRPEEAAEVARRAEQGAAASRNALLECRAWLVGRMAAWRAEAPMEVDPDGREAATAVSALCGATACQVDAAIGFRDGQWPDTAAIALRGVQLAVAGGNGHLELLMRAVHLGATWRAGQPVDVAHPDVRALVDDLLRTERKLLAAQGLALIAGTGACRGREEDLTILVRHVSSQKNLHLPREVITLEAARAMLEAATEPLVVAVVAGGEHVER